jgi:ABC-type phosphate transport system substrate-binding protein
VDIFLGKDNDFPGDGPAVPIDQDESSAEREEFYQKFAGKSRAQIKAFWSKMIFTGRGQPPREASNDIEMKKLIVNQPGAIGYIDRKLVDDSVKIVRVN